MTLTRASVSVMAAICNHPKDSSAKAGQAEIQVADRLHICCKGTTQHPRLLANQPRTQVMALCRLHLRKVL